MKIGIKFGPENFNAVLEKTSPDCAEVWFRLDWWPAYRRAFEELRAKNIPFGLHYWHVIQGGIEPNLAYEPDGIADTTEKTMRETIDIAQEIGATYVNIHPGSYSLREIDLDKQQMRTLHDKSIQVDKGNISLEKRAKRLHEYAVSKKVLFFIETLPKNEIAYGGRENVLSGNSIGIEVLEHLGEQGLFLTNDFGHTLARWTGLSSEELYDNLLNATKRLAPFTKLIHLNTVRPPFNGTDSHNGVLQEDFKLGVIPNREQIVHLLRLFKERDDVWIIPEPEKEKMTTNFTAIKELVKEL